jgi:xylulokinase
MRRLVGTDAAALTGASWGAAGPGQDAVPALSGRRAHAPERCRHPRRLPGLEHATDRAAATRAVLEGVTFAIRDSRDALAATGTRIDT